MSSRCKRRRRVCRPPTSSRSEVAPATGQCSGPALIVPSGVAIEIESPGFAGAFGAQLLLPLTETATQALGPSPTATDAFAAPRLVPTAS